MSEKEIKIIGGLQVETINEIDSFVRSAHGVYGEIVAEVEGLPDGKALSIEFHELKKATTRVSGLRAYLKRHNLLKEFTVVRRKTQLYIAKVKEIELE